MPKSLVLTLPNHLSLIAKSASHATGRCSRPYRGNVPLLCSYCCLYPHPDDSDTDECVMMILLVMIFAMV